MALQRREVAEGCRILAHEQLSDGVLGHISVRSDGDRVLVRCRGRDESGLLHTTPEDVRAVDRLGAIVDGGDGYRVPNELPMHLRILEARPDVSAVVHVHPPDIVTCSLAGIALRPIFGAYDIPATMAVSAGVGLYPRSWLINNDDVANELVAALGQYRACVLRGHGLVCVGETVRDAVLTALGVNAVASMTLSVARLGTAAPPLPEDELSALPNLGRELNEDATWRHYLSRLGRLP